MSELQLLHFPEPPDGGSGGDGGGGGVGPGSSGHGDSAVLVLAGPNADGLPLHGLFAAEGTRKLGVLSHLHLLDGLPQRGAVPCPVLANHAGLLRPLGLFIIQ